MAHVIKLATQAFMGTVSTSKHYNPASPEADLVSTSDKDDCNTISVIHAIIIKVSETDLNYSVSYNVLQAQLSAKQKECSKVFRLVTAHCNYCLT